MKKYISLSLVLVIALVLVGCASEPEPVVQQEGPSREDVNDLVQLVFDTIPSRARALVASDEPVAETARGQFREEKLMTDSEQMGLPYTLIEGTIEEDGEANLLIWDLVLEGGPISSFSGTLPLDGEGRTTVMADGYEFPVEDGRVPRGK